MVEEEALRRQDRLVALEKMLERRNIGFFGMAALQRLAQLLRIA
jgi:hypothetical protein